MAEDQCFVQIRLLRVAAAREGVNVKLRPVLSRSGRAKPAELVGRTENGDYLVDVSLPGLYGRHGVLPDYFTDELQKNEDGPLRYFLDIFNQRALKTFQDIWEQYHPFTEDILEAKSNKAKAEADLLDRLSGVLVARADQGPDLRAMRWHDMPLFRHPVRSQMGLMELVRSYFPKLNITYAGYEAHRRAIPQNQQATLGIACSQLGMDFLCGDYLMDPGAGFRLTFHQLDLETYMSFREGGKRRHELVRLFAAYTESRWLCSLTLGLRLDAVPPMMLGEERGLGVEAFLGGCPPEDDPNVEKFDRHNHEILIKAGYLSLEEAA